MSTAKDKDVDTRGVGSRSANSPTGSTAASSGASPAPSGHRSSHPLTEAVGAATAAGHTFGSFVDACRKLGITDEMELASVEFGIAQCGSGRLVAEIGTQGIEVREL